MQGAGDLIKKATDALGIEQCEGCKERQEALNRLIPFNRQKKADLKFLKSVFEWYNGFPIPSDKAKDIEKCEAMWMRIFNVKSEACKTCGSQYQENYMNRLREYADSN